ncbi:MAG: tetraacyldisaccharide 4'-kinase [Bacteroidota bacterium]
MNWRMLLFPFSILYGMVTAVRNFLYDGGVLRSASFEKPVILVGNLSMGGTGKTPHVEYLIRLLQDRYRVATLSRGYGRQSKGFQLAGADASSAQLGDEPFMYHRKYPNIQVAVCVNRGAGLQRLFASTDGCEVVLMDDGYQHRSVTPSLQILLTPHGSRFTQDHVLPMGNLREPRSGYWRADIIMVTGCPQGLTENEKHTIIEEIKPLPTQHVFFSRIAYASPVAFSNSSDTIDSNSEVVAFAGIAHPGTFFHHAATLGKSLHTYTYADHHRYTANEIQRIINSHPSNTVFVTTEKDFVRLQSDGLLSLFAKHSACYVPIQIQIDRQDAFHAMILKHVAGIQD